MSGGLRLVRGGVLALSMVLLTSLVHIQAHGDLPSAGTLLAMTPLVLVLSALVLARPRGTCFFVVFSISTQALLHMLLTVGAGHGSHHASLVPSAGMLAAHLGAAIATALILSRGDALLHRWLSMLCTALTAPTITIPAIASKLGFLASRKAPRFNSRDLDHAIHRRGPPFITCN